MRRRGRLLIPGLALALVGACVTINVYFPEAEIEDLSERIEEEVARQAAEQDDEAAPAGGDDSGGAPEEGSGGTGVPAIGWLDGLLGVTPAHAAEVEDPGITNPAIQKIIDSRAKRVDALERFKDMGVIGEGRDGMLAIRDLSRLEDLRQRAQVQKLVREENRDRQALYREIAEAKDLDPSQVSQVAQTYAETLRERAEKGHWVQLPDGSWKQK